MNKRKDHYSSFEINIEPVGDVDHFVATVELFVQIDGSQIGDFDRFKHVINGHVVLCVFGQNGAFVVKDSEVAYGRSSTNDHVS